MSRAKRPRMRRPIGPSTKQETPRNWASLGRKVAQHDRNAHRFTSETARAAGKRGGEVIAKDREHMRELGRRGGTAKAKARKAAQEQQTEMPADVDHTDHPSE